MDETQRNLKLYHKKISNKKRIIFVLFLLLLAIAVISISLGTIPVSLKEIWDVLGYKSGLIKTALETDTVDDSILNHLQKTEMIITRIRLPRIVAAMLIGALLSITGVVMQCVLHNPLASASTLGVSQGAAFGAALGIVVFGGGVIASPTSSAAIEIQNPYIVTLCAFVFAMLSTLVVLLISRFKRDIGPTGLILAGVALSSLFTGGSTLLQYFADETKLTAVVFWTFGNLGSVGWNEIGILFAFFLLTFTFFMLNRWNYNTLRSGFDTAQSLGVNTRKLMLTSMFVCSLSAAVAISFVGIISFVGLIAPHITRRLVGEDYRFLITGSALMGSLILILADIFARMIITPVILPIGAITSFLGAPLFLTLLIKGMNPND